MMAHPADSALDASFFSSRQAITDFLFVSDEPEAVDICVVLGSPSPTNIEPAVALYRSGLTRVVLITGHGPREATEDRAFPPEHVALRDGALRAGIPEAALLVEQTATNTLENFTRSAALIDARFGWANVRAVAVAGKPLHMRRALMTARRHWPGHLRLVMQPSKSPDDLQSGTWWQTEQGRQRVFRELKCIGEYAMKSHIGGV
jgi:uncharacterized SAM-binding protein YcdF (DUF218 family)